MRPDRPGDLHFLPQYMMKRLMYRTLKNECVEEEVLVPSFATFWTWWTQELAPGVLNWIAMEI